MHTLNALRLILVFSSLLGTTPFVHAAATAPAPAGPTVTPSAALPSKTGVANPTLDVYATPGQMVDIGNGRRLNLRCSGSGTPTVILESGAIADSMAWASVQGKVSKLTRVCSYDRAGLGFSDGGPLPRNSNAAVADLHALIAAGKLDTPVILVGHSLGSVLVRHYAMHYQTQTAALVLLDPPPQNVAAFSAAIVKADADALPGRLEFVRACGAAAEAGKLDHPVAALKDCLRPPDPGYSNRLNSAIRTNHLRPVYWQTLASIFETNVTLLAPPVSQSERHTAQPLLVLSAKDALNDVPEADRVALEKARELTNQLIALTSKRAERIVVEHSSHEIPHDRPDAVVDAIARVLTQVKAIAAAAPALPAPH